MKRRSFLAMLGLAPIAAVPAASASAQTPNDYLRETISNMFEAAKADWAVDVDVLTADVEKHQQWAGEGVRAMARRIDHLDVTIADT